MSPSLALCLVLSMPLQAQAPSPAAPPSAPARAAAPQKGGEPAKTPPVKGERKSIKGTLSAIDTDAMTVAFRDEEGRAFTWSVDKRLAGTSPQRAALAMQALNPGDSIVIIYNDDDGRPVIMEVRRARPKRAGDDRPQG